MTTTTTSPTTSPTSPTSTGQQERADLLQSLQTHRGFLRYTVQGLTEEQARQRPTVSALCLGGLVKHVSAMEQQWVDFVLQGADAFGTGEAEFADGFSLAEDETLADVLAAYERVAARTDELVVSLPSLDCAHALPAAPWFPPGAAWSARRVLLHLVAETAQHAGHADVLRESLDGQRTMG